MPGAEKVSGGSPLRRGVFCCRLSGQRGLESEHRGTDAGNADGVSDLCIFRDAGWYDTVWDKVSSLFVLAGRSALYIGRQIIYEETGAGYFPKSDDVS